MRAIRKKKKFIYLISPNKIDKNFYKKLETLFKSDLIYFFQQRFKRYSLKKNLSIGLKVKKLCKKYKVKFIINDDPYLTIKLNADGCHLGRKDMKISEARKILKNKIIGSTCNNSKKLIIESNRNNVDYVALGAFNKSKTKRVKYFAKINLIKWTKNNFDLPVVAIGGINSSNYKKLLLHKADFLAISGYLWRNNPSKVIKEFL